MTARHAAVLSAALLLGVGCSQNSTGPNGGSGDTGTTDCKLVGEWQGRLKFLAADGFQLPPHMQLEVPGDIRLAFNRAGHVTETQHGVTATFARVGDKVIGGNPLGNGVVFTWEVLKLTASANQVELHIKSYSGQAASGDPIDPQVFEKNGVVKYTYTLAGNQLEVRYVGTSNAGGRTEVIEAGGIFQRVGGGNGGNGGQSGGGW